MIFRKLHIMFLLLLALSLVACDSKKSDKKQKDKPTPVTVYRATSQQINVPYTSIGSIRARKNPTVKAEVEGLVVKLLVKVGDPVALNQKLAELNSKRQTIELEKAKAELATAETNVTEKMFIAERYRQAYKKGAISLIKFKTADATMKVMIQRLNVAKEALAAAEHNLERTIIKSPISGHVQKIFIAVGDFAKPGTPIVKLINPDELIAELPFSQERVSKLQVGQNIRMVSPATPGKMYVGTVDAIEPSIDPNNRAFNVIIHFQNFGNWHSGSSAGAQIYLTHPERGFMLPKESVVLRANGDYIFYLKNGRATMVQVTILHSWLNKVAVTAKMPSPVNVVVDGASYLSNNAPVTVTKTLKLNL